MTEPSPERTMQPDPRSGTCAILADRHMVLTEGLRGLLETAFQTVYMVADEQSLREGAQHLAPAVIVMDLSFVGPAFPQLLQDIRKLSPRCRVLALSVHDQPLVARLALEAGALGIVLKRCVGTEFMPAIDAMLRGEVFVSPDFGLTEEPFAHH